MWEKWESHLANWITILLGAVSIYELVFGVVHQIAAPYEAKRTGPQAVGLAVISIATVTLLLYTVVFRIIRHHRKNHTAEISRKFHGAISFFTAPLLAGVEFILLGRIFPKNIVATWVWVIILFFVWLVVLDESKKWMISRDKPNN
jgi:hypothetical protein